MRLVFLRLYAAQMLEFRLFCDVNFVTSVPLCTAWWAMKFSSVVGSRL